LVPTDSYILLSILPVHDPHDDEFTRRHEVMFYNLVTFFTS